MKHNVLRRLGALALALAVALTLIVMPASAAEGDVTITGPQTLKVNAKGEFEASVEGVTGASFHWTCSPAASATFSDEDAAKTTVTAGTTIGEVTLTVTAKWTPAATDTDPSPIEQTKTADYKVTISDVDPTTPPDPTQPPEDVTKINSLMFDPKEYTWGQDAPNPFDVTVIANPMGYTGDIAWYIRKMDPDDPDIISIITNGTVTDGNNEVPAQIGKNKTVRVTSLGPAGEVYLVARAIDEEGGGTAEAAYKITISGIVLSSSELTMTVGESR